MPDLEDHQESTFWPWVLGIVILALVVWVAAELTSSEADGVVMTAPPQPPAAEQSVAGPVVGSPAAFQAWVRDSAAALERSDGEDYVAAGLNRMTAAVLMLARHAGRAPLVRRADSLHLAALPPVDAGYLAAVQQRFMAVLALTGELQQLIEPDSEIVDRNIERAAEAADELDPSAPLQQQRHRVYRYFEFVSEALQELADDMIAAPE